MANGKVVKQPRGSSAFEDSVVGAEGQLRVDLGRNEIHLHDGQTPGGHRIPNFETIQHLIAFGGNIIDSAIQIYASEDALAIAAPDTQILAVVKGQDREDSFIWRPGLGDGGDVPSSISGHWHRLDGDKGFWIRLWRAGIISMQINGAQPVANQDVTVWMTSGEVKLWDGDSYEDVTPALFARLLASIGDYYTGAISLPNRIAEVAYEVADVDTIDKSGWYRTAAADPNSPIAGVHPVFAVISDSTGFMMVHNTTTAAGQFYVKRRIAGAWESSWVLYSMELPDRLKPRGKIVTDLNNAIEAGFYSFADTAANAPAAEAGTLIVLPGIDDDYVRQIAMLNGSKLDRFKNDAGVWQPWVQTWPLTGIIPIANGGTGQSTAKAAIDSLDSGEATLASANTINIAAVDSRNLVVTGVATIVSFGAGSVGQTCRIRFTGALILTHSAALQLPNNTNLQIAPGDRTEFRCVATNQWMLVNLLKANGRALVEPSQPLWELFKTETWGGSGNRSTVLPGAPYRNLLITGQWVATSNAGMNIRFSFNGGVSYPVTISAGFQETYTWDYRILVENYRDDTPEFAKLCKVTFNRVIRSTQGAVTAVGSSFETVNLVQLHNSNGFTNMEHSLANISSVNANFYVR